MRLTIESRIELNHGGAIPVLGLGVYQIPPGEKTLMAVTEGLKAGYRLFDTAAFYGNEAAVGRAIREFGIARNEVFVTTKLWNNDHGYDSTLQAFDHSLKNFGFDFLDLYLIHWPVTGKRLDSYKALQRILGEGKTKAIGVSNFTIAHLKELLEHTEVVPAVNQVEFHPFLYQKDLLDFCKTHRILLEAYSPLTKAQRFKDPFVLQTAAKYRKTSAQVLIRWGLQQGAVEIPKSKRPKRIQENADVFDFVIEEEDMKRLDSLNEDYRCSWDPTDVV